MTRTASSSMATAAALSAAAVVLLLLSAAPVPASAQLMPLVRYGATVAGLINDPGSVNGPAGTSRLSNPLGICGGYESSAEDINNDLLLIGTARTFRTFNRSSTDTGLWFGEGTGSNLQGPIADATLRTPYGCARFNPAAPIIYYVSGSSVIFYVVDGVLASVDIGSGVVLQDVTIYTNRLYLISQIGVNIIYRCFISATNPAPQGCQAMVLQNIQSIFPSPNNGQRGIAVNERGIFIASGSAIAWYNNPDSGTATPIQTDLSIPFVDVRSIAGVGGAGSTVLGITTTTLYSITFPTPTTWDIALVVGSGTTDVACTREDQNRDGPDPTFCGLYRMYPASSDEIYFTLADLTVVRSMTVPPMEVPYTFPRRPFPIGFVQEENIMPQLLGLMASDLNGALGTTGVAVKPGSGVVDPDWWNTEFTIDVPQREYDLTTTRPAIEQMDFGNVLSQLADYYNLTDEVIYTDANLLPMCDLNKLNYIQHAIANKAREVLMYPLIYTDPPETVTVDGNPNITRVKLLMPSAFGAPANQTTHPLIESANFSEAMVTYVTDSYNPNRVYVVDFQPSSDYPFARLTPDQLQQVRWMVQEAVMERLRQCARDLGEPEDGGQSQIIDGGHSDSSNSNGTNNNDGLVPGCVPTIGITNETMQDLSGQQGYQTDYTVFIPDTMNYSFDISRCLDGMNKDDIFYFIRNVTIEKPGRKCDTGCIVGIAVAAAVVAAILIVVLVVLVSKRKRLATVVAPGASAPEPKFASTLDDEDSFDSVGNPLQR